MALSGIIAIPDLDKDKIKEVKILKVVIRTRKTSFTCLLGSEDGSTANLLMEGWSTGYQPALRYQLSARPISRLYENS